MARKNNNADFAEELHDRNRREEERNVNSLQSI
jgi:hypothetical protein